MKTLMGDLISPKTKKILEEIKSMYGHYLTWEEENELPPLEKKKYRDLWGKIQEGEYFEEAE